jgi:hypothetical protein
VQAQLGHSDPAMTLGVYAKAVRNGRRSARSRRTEGLERAPMGTATSAALASTSEGLVDGTAELPGLRGYSDEALYRTRTDDPFLTMEVLYQLS